MTQELTLSIDKELLYFAHTYSKQNGVSVSNLFEQYLADLKNSLQKDNLSTITDRLYGLLQDSPFPDKEDLRKLFHEKNSNRFKHYSQFSKH